MINLNMPWYNPPGILIGPIPYIKQVFGTSVIYSPDYSHPGVAERIKIEVDMIEDEAFDKRKL